MDNEVAFAIHRMIKAYADNMPIDGVMLLSENMSIKCVAKDDVIHHIGEETNFIYFICSGLARSYYIDSLGNDITHYFIRENDFCCSEFLLQNVSSYLCYEALEDCRLLCIPKRDMQNLINTSNLCNKIYVSLLEKSLCYKITREWGFLSKSAAERYTEFIENNKDLKNRIRQSHLASYIGVTPVSLSRIKKILKEEHQEEK